MAITFRTYISVQAFLQISFWYYKELDITKSANFEGVTCRVCLFLTKTARKTWNIDIVQYLNAVLREIIPVTNTLTKGSKALLLRFSLDFLPFKIFGTKL